MSTNQQRQSTEGFTVNQVWADHIPVLATIQDRVKSYSPKCPGVQNSKETDAIFCTVFGKFSLCKLAQSYTNFSGIELMQMRT